MPYALNEANYHSADQHSCKYAEYAYPVYLFHTNCMKQQYKPIRR